MNLAHWGFLEAVTPHEIKQRPGGVPAQKTKAGKGGPPQPANGNKGVHNPRVKLTEEQVLEIYRELLRDKHSAPRLAKRYGVNNATIRAIGYRTTWRHVTGRLF